MNINIFLDRSNFFTVILYSAMCNGTAGMALLIFKIMITPSNQFSPGSNPPFATETFRKVGVFVLSTYAQFTQLYK